MSRPRVVAVRWGADDIDEELPVSGPHIRAYDLSVAWTKRRQALNDHLRGYFGGPTPARPSRLKAFVYVLLIFLGFVATFFRYPQPWRFTLWSEDGGIFFEQAASGSALDVLTRPYAGYLHLFPRAVAEFLSWLPVESVPVATMAVMAMVTSVLAAAVYFLCAAHVRSHLARLVVWALFAAAPIAGMEIAGSLANFQWYLLGGLLLAVFARRGGWVGGAISAAVVLVGFGSSVLALLFLPFLALRALTFRKRQDLILLTLAVGCVQ